MNRSNDIREQLAPYLAALEDGSLSAEMHSELEALLDAEPPARDYVARYLTTAALIEWEMGEKSGQLSASSPQPSTVKPTKSLLSRTLKHERFVAIAAGVMFIVGLLSWAAMTYMPEVAEKKEEEAEPLAEKHVAILNGERGVKWVKGEREKAWDPRLWPGEKLVIEEGLIELKYVTGARVVIEGPAEYWVGTKAAGTKAQSKEVARSSNPQSSILTPQSSSNSGFLKHGKLVARCETKASKGFTVHTPSSRVVDLGTEFGVDVDQLGKMQVAVLTGEVDVISGDGTGPEQRVKLVRGQAAFASANGGKIRHYKQANARLVAAMRGRLKLLASANSQAASVVDAATFFRGVKYDSYNDHANANISPFASTFGSLTSFSGGSAGGSAVGPTYHDFRGLSATATAGKTYFFLEDYQDGLANSPGVTYSAGAARTNDGRNGSDNTGANTDSVDEDNGKVDDDRSSGSKGAYRVNATLLTITFDAVALGGLPTHVGVVDAQASKNSSDVEFFAADGVTSLGSINGGANPGPNSPDIFVGAIHPGGISRIEITKRGSEIEWEGDHLQYGRFVAAPERPSPKARTQDEEITEK